MDVPVETQLTGRKTKLPEQTSSDLSHQFLVFVTTTAEKRAMVVYRNQWKMWLVYPVSATSLDGETLRETCNTLFVTLWSLLLELISIETDMRQS